MRHGACWVCTQVKCELSRLSALEFHPWHPHTSSSTFVVSNTRPKDTIQTTSKDFRTVCQNTIIRDSMTSQKHHPRSHHSPKNTIVPDSMISQNSIVPHSIKSQEHHPTFQDISSKMPSFQTPITSRKHHPRLHLTPSLLPKTPPSQSPWHPIERPDPNASKTTCLLSSFLSPNSTPFVPISIANCQVSVGPSSQHSFPDSRSLVLVLPVLLILTRLPPSSMPSLVNSPSPSSNILLLSIFPLRHQIPHLSPLRSAYHQIPVSSHQLLFLQVQALPAITIDLLLTAKL